MCIHMSPQHFSAETKKGGWDGRGIVVLLLTWGSLLANKHIINLTAKDRVTLLKF